MESEVLLGLTYWLMFLTSIQLKTFDIKGEVPKWNKFETTNIVVHGQLGH
jgi:hypothetical protein